MKKTSLFLLSYILLQFTNGELQLGEQCEGFRFPPLCAQGLICEDPRKPGLDMNACLNGYCQCADPSAKVQEATIHLSNADFRDGTYMALRDNTEYILDEDIVFHPQPLFPSKDRKKCGNYCGKEFGLGFFAVMLINAKNVKLNLNGFEMRASEEFMLTQRFHSIIELGRTPFITNQGPGFFGEWNSKLVNIEIFGGTLGLNSHHAIHGNDVQDVYIHDLKVKDFEVIGIHLNGVKNVRIENVEIEDMLTSVPFDSKLSHTRFLVELFNTWSSDQLNQKFKDETVAEIKQKLEKMIKDAKESGLANEGQAKQPYNGFFKKENGKNGPKNLHDGSYGGAIIIRGAKSAGVAIGPFSGTTKAAPKSKGSNVVLKNIRIEGILLDPAEWVVLQLIDTDDVSDKNYFSAHGAAKGPFGDVMHPDNWKLNMDQKFQPTILAAGQIAACLLGTTLTRGKTCSEPVLYALKDLYDGTYTFREFLKYNNHKWVCNRDSMAHVMKGAVGMRLEDLNDLTLEDIHISEVKNYGGEDSMHTEHCSDEIYRGGDAFGMVLGNVDKIHTIGEIEIFNVHSEKGVAASVATNGQLSGLNFFSGGNWITEGVSSATIATEFYTCPRSGQTIVEVGWGKSTRKQSCPVMLCDKKQDAIPSEELECGVTVLSGEKNGQRRLLKELATDSSFDTKIFAGFAIFVAFGAVLFYQRPRKEVSTGMVMSLEDQI